MRHRLFLFCYLLALFPAYIFAAPADSLSDVKIFKTFINYFHEKDFIYGKYTFQTPDTSITRIHQVNPLLDLHYNFLGTLGSAGVAQTFTPNTSLYTFTSTHSYDLQMLNSDSIRYFRTNKRYSEVTYHSGAFKEQAIQLFHTQNILRNWNAGFLFDRQGLKDFMNYSSTFRSRFSFFTWYASPNNKYNLFAHATWNTIKNGVNGGLTSDSLFDNTTVSNLGIKGLAYQIAGAEEHSRKKIFLLSQYYDLGKVFRDTSGNVIKKSPALRLHHEISFERKSFVYSDSNTDSSFYSDYYYGEATYDSLHSDEIRNRVAIQLPADTFYTSKFLRNWSSGIFAEQRHTTYGQRTDSSWDNLSVGANIFIKTDTASFELFAEGTTVISGFDNGNYLLNAKAYSPQFSFGRLGIEVSTGQTSPDLIYRLYDGNNFSWKNRFSPLKNLVTSAVYELKKFNFSIRGIYMKIDNYVYLGSDALPVQFGKTITIQQVVANKNFRYRYWHFDNIITWQKTDYEGIIHMPMWVTDQSLYYENYFFKKALLAAFGMAANYNSFYHADAFMPANSLFYFQNTTKTGGYLRLDLFINTQIKTARIFVKMENAADGLFKRSYYLTPHYPMPGRVLKFGLTWRFLDQ